MGTINRALRVTLLTRDRLAILLTLLALAQLVALWLVMP